jgi:hypothetical protein
MPLNDKFKTATKRAAPIILIHGPPGSWKTEFACGAPSPAYFDLENSLGPDRAEKVAACKPATFQEIIDTIKELITEEHSYKSVVLDTLDHLAPLIESHALADENVSSWVEITKRDGWAGPGRLEEKWWRILFRGLEKLTEKGITCILLAHSNLKEVESPTTDSYARWEPKLSKRANAVAIELSGIIGFSTQKVVVREVDGGDRSVAVNANADFTLTLNPRPSVVAKNRMHLPDGIKTTWADFVEAAKAAKNTTNQTKGA